MASTSDAFAVPDDDGAVVVVASTTTPQQPVASALATTTAATKLSNNTGNEKSVIDLCGGDEGDSVAAEYAASMVQLLSTKKKRQRATDLRRSPRTHKSARAPPVVKPTPPDAIVIDDCATATVPSTWDARTFANVPTPPEESDTAYLRALGPVRMDFVAEWKGGAAGGSDHAYAAANAPARKMRCLYRELLEYQLNLPVAAASSVFVRAQESRLDLLRVLITGPEGTPYSNGCFYFDLQLTDYPEKAPVVKFLSTGQGKVRFNPNLYNCGKVCLSLLGTWNGPGWVAGKSTVLQVLVSIQGLILVDDPYFNEPGFELARGTKSAEEASDAYNVCTRRSTLQYCLLEPLEKAARTIRGGTNCHDYPEFAVAVVRHFAVRAAALERQLQEWTSLDKSLLVMADAARKHLAVVVSAFDAEQSQKPAAQLYRMPRVARAEPELVFLD